jgi:hypothetical protein
VAELNVAMEPGIGLEPMTFSLQDRSDDPALCGFAAKAPSIPTVLTS